MGEDAKAVIGIILAIVVVVGMIVSLAFWADAVKCANRAAMMGKPHQFALLLGCMIEVDGEFIPLDAYKVIR